MLVDIVRELKFSKLDHLFVLLAEGKHDDLGLPEVVRKLVRDAAFDGRADVAITVLAGEPRKVTLIGLGKRDALSVRGVRGAGGAVGRTAKKQRDKAIGVIFPYTLPQIDGEQTTRVIADALAQSDYKYDPYITVKKDQKRFAIDAALLAPESLDKKRVSALAETARAIAAGVTTVRDLGNMPCNILTPERLAERAEEVSKDVGVKCTVSRKRDIERMKMGGLLAVNRGSVLEPRFVVMEYTPKRAKKHVALVGKGITFDSGGISIKPAEKM